MRSELVSCLLMPACLLTMATALPARADILIGVAGPMSGSFAQVGQDMATGVDLGIAAVNAAGGVDGEALRAVVLDDKCDPTAGAAVANQLIGRGVRFVIGHACTSAALAAAAVYVAHKVPLISPATTNPRFTDEGAGPGVFRLAVRSDLQAKAIADHLLARFPKKRVAFVHDGGVYGQGLVEAAARLFVAGGGVAAMTEAFTPGERSQNSLVGHIQDAGVVAVVMGALAPDAAVIVAGVRARGLDAELIGSEALGLDDFPALAGPSGDGVVFMLPDVAPRGAEADAFRAAIAARNQPATDAAAAADAAVAVAARAMAGHAGFEAVVARLRGAPLPSLIGPVAFDAKGDWTAARYVPMSWRGDDIVPLDR